jgi:transcriptional regulator with XRE-family HTH domain
MVGEALRLLRVFNDVKLVALAKTLAISPGFLSEIETGKRRPNIDLIKRYAKHFGVRASAILFFTEELDESKTSGRVKSVVRDKLIMILKTIEVTGKGAYGSEA